jgi:hypothetical protein
MTNGSPEVVPILIYSPESATEEYRDVMFVHEIVHAVELSLTNPQEKLDHYKCGFEHFDDEDKREYEAFNEIITQFIAMEITESLHEDGMYLFNTGKNAKIKGGTSYEQYNFLVNDFYQNYKNEILESRLDNNLDLLFNTVGKENFDSLNKLISEYKNLPYYELMDDLMNKRTTQLTNDLNSILTKSEEVNQRMVNTSNIKESASLER